MSELVTTLRCEQVKHLPSLDGGICQEVKLRAPADPAGPPGVLDFQINNPQLAGFFVPGARYRVRVLAAPAAGMPAEESP